MNLEDPPVPGDNRRDPHTRCPQPHQDLRRDRRPGRRHSLRRAGDALPPPVPNRSGKTTMIKLLTGRIRPSGGAAAISAWRTLSCTRSIIISHS